MIKIENTEVFGWEAAIRGMRNPKNSWDLSDSYFCKECINKSIPNAKCPIEVDGGDIDKHYFNGCYIAGENDLKLMKTLAKAGDDHGKFLRMINVTVDLTAPLYWWKEHDQYKVGTTTNSCSTMHKIHAKEFTLDDFSHEHLTNFCLNSLRGTIDHLNLARRNYLELKNKMDWWQMIQLLPSSYNQKRTVQLNYAVLKNMYYARRHHKLDEWHDLCDWMLTLPYFKEICVQEER
jgi:hypothetical protein